MDKQYLNAFINDSPTIRDKVKDAITDAAPAVGLLPGDTWADDAGSTPAGTNQGKGALCRKILLPFMEFPVIFNRKYKKFPQPLDKNRQKCIILVEIKQTKFP